MPDSVVSTRDLAALLVDYLHAAHAERQYLDDRSLDLALRLTLAKRLIHDGIRQRAALRAEVDRLREELRRYTAAAVGA